MVQHSPSSAPRWLHAWAVLTVAITLPLLFLGAEVTTKKVGMADPVGYRHPWELTQAFAGAALGLQIEYSHRIAGFTVGSCAVVLVVALWLFEPRRWVRWVGVLALALVGIQGLLGIFRVNLDRWLGGELALIHGCFAQIVIATLIAAAAITSRGWVSDRADVPASPALRRWSLLTAALIYGQLVLGGMLRHKGIFLLGSRLHLLGAFVVLGAVVWLMKLGWESERRASLAFSLMVLVALVGFQILLGIETWLTRAHLYYIPGGEPLPNHADWLRSAHYVAGTLIFVTGVVIALKANRRLVVEDAAPAPTLEAAL
jgi:cytochrome c oxidase assembly protein subunit 15